MRGALRSGIVGLLLVLAAEASAADPALDGSSLGEAAIVRFARAPDGVPAIAPDAARRVAEGFDLVMEAAARGTPVYGLTVGVGWNKDRPVFRDVGGRRVLDAELIAFSRRFNRMMLRAHGAGIAPDLPPEVVRAAMLIRLNTMLSGAAGVQPSVVATLHAFLDKGLTPVVPARGSVGEADITLASHIGLAMIGEWLVDYQGRRMPAGEALAAAGIAPLDPVGKDFLSIVSSNALFAGQAALLAADVAAYLDRAAVVFGLALEGFNGNIAPFLPQTTAIRPFPGMVEAARTIREALDGSHLWQVDDGRALQDPLSFRTMAYALGSAREALADLRAALRIQVNHGDDNPAVIAGPWTASPPGSSQVERYRVDGAVVGTIYPTANFEMLPVAVRVEQLTAALARLSQNVAAQTIRFENPDLTKLPRFLAAPGNIGHAFGALQKPLAALFAENRQLAMPVSLDTLAMAGNIEDTASNAPLALANLGRVLDNLYHMSSVQLLHAAQAVDLRGPRALGKQTHALLQAYRARVPFVAEDRSYTADFAAGAEVLRRFEAARTP